MKKVLLITDVPNWGGHERAIYIKKYLSDEFDFDISFNSEFKKVNNDIFLKNEKYNSYDLYYFLFHTMIEYGYVRYLLNNGSKKTFTSITGRDVYKKIFKNKKNCYDLLHLLSGVSVNNMLTFNDFSKIYKKKLYYLPRGIDESVFYSYEKYNKDRELNVLYVGKHVEEKGLDSIIKPACEKAGVNLITNTRIWKNALNKDEMRELYNLSDLYIVASTSDGTPNPALEAMACGRPVISNNIGNMPEVIINGYNGFLVDRKIDAYVEKIKYFDNNRDKLLEMGKNARKSILNGWTWYHTTKRERDMMREILYG